MTDKQDYEREQVLAYLRRLRDYELRRHRQRSFWQEFWVRLCFREMIARKEAKVDALDRAIREIELNAHREKLTLAKLLGDA